MSTCALGGVVVISFMLLVEGCWCATVVFFGICVDVFSEVGFVGVFVVFLFSGG